MYNVLLFYSIVVSFGMIALAAQVTSSFRSPVLHYFNPSSAVLHVSSRNEHECSVIGIYVRRFDSTTVRPLGFENTRIQNAAGKPFSVVFHISLCLCQGTNS